MSTTIQHSGVKLPELTPTELRNYSIARAIASADPRNPRSCLEREISETLSRTLKRQPSGILLHPAAVFGPAFLAGRAFNLRTLEATGSGATTIGTEALPLIHYIAPRSKAMRLGMGMAPVLFGADSGGQVMGIGDVVLPVETSSDEGEWCGESETSTGDHASEFGAAIAKPKRIFAQREISRQFFAQSVGGGEAVKRTVGFAIANAIDRAAFSGAGAKQPIGIVNAVDVNVVSHGTDGGAPTRAKLTEAEAAAITANAPLSDAFGYVLSPNARKKLKTTPVVVSGERFLLETINGQDFVNGYPAFASGYLSDTNAKGSGSNLGEFVCGEWSASQIAMWGVVEISSDFITQVRNGKVVIWCDCYADTLHPRPDLFTRARDLVTT